MKQQYNHCKPQLQGRELGREERVWQTGEDFMLITICHLLPSPSRDQGVAGLGEQITAGGFSAWPQRPGKDTIAFRLCVCVFCHVLPEGTEANQCLHKIKTTITNSPFSRY